METTAFFSRPQRPTLADSPPQPTLHMPQYLVGEHVQIGLGPLAGMQGLLVKQAADGRWVVQLSDVGAGVLLCIDSRHFARRS